VKRILEPELMDDPSQANAYAAADFADVNQSFVDRFLALCGQLDNARVVDLGCGPGDIALRLAAARPSICVTGVDGAASMLALARADADRRGLADRVSWVHARLPGALPDEQFDAVVSNSLLHHLPDPDVLWAEIGAIAAADAPVLVVDLMRPTHRHRARELVDTYAAGEPDVLRTDFYNSLLAAFTADEVQAQLDSRGLPLEIEIISDRHLAISGRL